MLRSAKLLFTLNLIAAPVCSAEIALRDNPYSMWSDSAEYFNDKEVPSEFRDDDFYNSPQKYFANFLNNELFVNFEPRGSACVSDEQRFYVMETNAIVIEGEIDEDDYAKYLNAVNEEQKLLLNEEYACPYPIVINSTGGDMNAAIAIGKRVSLEGRAVIVGDGAVCLSACMLILMAAVREGEEGHYSVAYAFRNSMLGVHLPFFANLSESQRQDVARLAAYDPERLFYLMGEEWRRFTSYSQLVSRAPNYSGILTHQFALEPDGLYMIESKLERELLQITSLYGFGTFDANKYVGDHSRSSVPDETIESICLEEMARYYPVGETPNFIRAQNYVQEYRLGERWTWLIFEPVEQLFCAAIGADREEKIIFVIDTYSDGSASPDFPDRFQVALQDVVEEMYRATDDFEVSDELESIRLRIGQYVAELDQEESWDSDERIGHWDIYTRMFDSIMGSQAGGAFRGRVLFAGGWAEEDPAGISLVNHVFLRTIEKLIDDSEGLPGVGSWNVMLSPDGNSEPEFKVSSDCGTISGVCSLVSGVVDNGRVKLVYHGK